MELLILKSDKDYIRVTQGSYHLVTLDKASVFPLDRINSVEEHKIQLERQSYPLVCIKKLVLSEEDI